MSSTLFLLALLAQSPASPATPVTVTVLVRVDRPGDKAFADQLARATGAALTNAGFSYLPAPDRPLSEVQFTVGCTEFDASCAASIGKSLAASQVVVVQLLAPPAQGVAYALVDVASASRTRLGATAVARFDTLAAQQVAAAIARDLGSPARLEVRSQPEGAAVHLDGKPVGVTPLVLGEALEDGSHRLRLRFADGAEVEQSVPVRRGESSVVEVSLLGGAAAEPEPEAGVAGMIGWSMVGGSALAALGGGVLGGLAMLAKQRYEADQAVGGVTVQQISRSEAKDLSREIEAQVLGAEVAFAASLALALGSALVLGLSGG